MKKLLLSFVLFFAVVFVFGQAKWFAINSDKPLKNQAQLISSNISNSIVNFEVDGFYLSDINAEKSGSVIPIIPGASRFLDLGKPDLVKLTASLIVPNNSAVTVNVIESEYVEYYNIEIAPSKGNLLRSVNPNDIAYEYGAVYQKDEFFPGILASVSDPYIIRDLRGVALHTYPLQYNPVTKTLRVYTKIVTELTETEGEVVNSLNTANKSKILVKEFNNIYASHFLNYNSNTRYTPLEEAGGILVIAHGPYMDAMIPYVEWKNQIGHHTVMVDVATIGSTPQVIKAYIQDYFDNNDLTYILLVGDAQHIPPFTLGSGFSTAHSDNTYAYLVGNDSYPDAFIGRFSAESVADVETQVQRTIEYEQAIGLTDGWLHHGMGVSRNEGAGQGHNGEADYQHMDLIRTRLLTYKYDVIYREYDGNVPGMSNTTAALISQRINDGVSLINYCNHGSDDGWSVANYHINNVNALTNTAKLPFINAVACVNGNFVGQTCFAEAWLRATHNGKPSGALVTFMSTINQSWLPPMDAQDEFNDILIGAYENNIKRSFGGIAMNSCMKMNDINGSAGAEMTNTWTIFGDPSVKIRTDNALPLEIAHDTEILVGETELTVYSPVIGAFVSLTIDNEIIGTGTIDANGSVTINFEELWDAEKEILVVATAYNRIPAFGNVEIIEELYDLDLQALRVLFPENYYPCVGNVVQPKVVVRNKGEFEITSFELFYALNDDEVQSIIWEGNLSSLQTDTIYLQEFVLVEGTHQFMFYVDNPNDDIDEDPENNQIIREFLVEDLDIIADFSTDEYNNCNAPVEVKFNNMSENAQSFVWNFGDGNESVQLNPSHIFTELGVYNVTLIADAGACGIQTVEKEIIIGAVPPQIENAVICQFESVEFVAQGNGEILWFDDETLNNQIATGNNYTTPELEASVTYYVYSLVESVVFGAKENQTAGLAGGYFTSENRHGLVFNASEPVVLKSVKVFSNQAKVRNIVLEDSDGVIIDQVNVNIPDGEHRVELNLNIPAGTEMILYGPGVPNLYREGETGSWWNPVDPLPYPYTVGDFINIVRSTAGGAEQNYYYYFYDWEVEKKCQSPVIEVTATVLAEAPIVEFTYNVDDLTVAFMDESEGLGDYLWDFGDGNSSSEQNPVHIYDQPGNYSVSLTISNDCFENNKEYSISILSVLSHNLGKINMYPNPANAFVNISSEEIIRNIEIYDVSGRIIFNQGLSDTYLNLDIANYQAGLYILRLYDTDGNWVSLRMIVE